MKQSFCNSLELSVPEKDGYEIVKITVEYEEEDGLGGQTRSFDPKVKDIRGFQIIKRRFSHSSHEA